MTRRRPKHKEWPIVVALDESWSESKIWTKRLKGKVWGFKVGSILFSEMGPKVVQKLKAEGFRIFLDLKYHDIPNTVAGAVRQAFDLGADLVTLHSSGGRAMCEAAAKLQNSKQSVLAVTVLTSFDEKDLKDLGIDRSLPKQVESLASLAIKSGVHGLVCSPLEVANLRKKFPKAILVTPGIRLEANGTQDQKRTSGLQDTFLNGASLAVVGRALTGEKNWKAAWEKINSSLEEIF
ncbi:MAG: orotidine-5'-phosphate decarboxylase [Deltaproteobacteria bacterium]|nr:orotidine-5'-phosphate decarboxylase [Deltaproteobacteria bacterium]